MGVNAAAGIEQKTVMTIVTIEQAGKYDGQEVTLKGWLYNLRESGKLLFPIFRDGTGIIQGVVALKENPETFEALKGLTQESSVIVTGKIRAEQRAPGGYEIGVTRIQILQKVSESTPFPIQLKEHGVDFLLDHRHLWIRTPRQASILRIRAEAVRAAREFMDSQGYTLTDAPIFTPAACEGTSTLFEVNYFDDQKAYLTQSGQLYIEATAMALGKVYTFGPTFRAEKSKTRRHLTEFWMLEPEAAYVELDEAMALGEGLVSAIVKSVLKNKSRELETLKRDAKKLENVKPPFPRITYEEAIGLLQKHGNPAKFGDDIGGDEETLISSQFDRPVLIHRYPTAIKAFYMQPDAQRPDLALAFDMIAPEGYGEIIGGSQRIHDYDLLVKRLREHNLPEEAFQWYLDLRRYGSVPHSGFGLGLERTVAWICGVEHIREVIPFPRMIYRVYP
jgi:asparaginyl-tRNA synthetase